MDRFRPRLAAPGHAALLLGAVALSARAVQPGAGLPAEERAAADADPVLVVEELAAASEVLPATWEAPAPGPSPARSSATLNWQLVPNGVPEEGDVPMELAFTPDGARILVANRESRNVTVFDAATRTVLATIPVSGSPNSIAMSSDGIHAITANLWEDTASILDVGAGTEVAVVPVGDQPALAAVTPDGTTGVIGNTVSEDISVINLATRLEIRRIAGASFVGSASFTSENATSTFNWTPFAVSPDNRTVVLPEYFNDRVQFYDLLTGTVTSVVTSPDPRPVVITQDGNTAVVGHSGTPLVTLYNVPTRAALQTFILGANVDHAGMAVNPAGTKAVIPIQNAARILDLVLGTFSLDLPTACCLDLTTTADGQYAFAGGFRGSLISYATETVVQDLNNVLSGSIAAVSPAGPRAALIANHFGENLLVFNTSGAFGSLEGNLPSGPPPEGDRARHVALSPTGDRAVVVNILSDNVTVVDLATRTVEAVLPVGDRPSTVAITPDGTKAAVAVLDEFFLAVVDLQAGTVDSVFISRRGAEVEISPDGRYAYVSVVADGDGVWRVDLNTLSVDGPKIATGDMGSIGFLFIQNSGIALSHDGGTLVTCNSFTDDVSIIDTATWSEVTRVLVGDFPVSAVFSADDSQIFVANKNANTVSIVDNNGVLSLVSGTLNTGDDPYHMVLTSDGSRLFVADRDASFNGHVSEIDVAGGATVGGVTLADPVTGIHLDASEQTLYAATGTSQTVLGPGSLRQLNDRGDLNVIDVATGIVQDRADFGVPPAMLAVTQNGALAALPSPRGDGLVLVDLVDATGAPAVAHATELRLERASPNPFGGRTRLTYYLPSRGQVALSVHDVAGRRVRTLVNGARAAGRHSVEWDGRDEARRPVSPGTYLLRLEGAGELRHGKVTLLD